MNPVIPEPTHPAPPPPPPIVQDGNGSSTGSLVINVRTACAAVVSVLLVLGLAGVAIELELGYVPATLLLIGLLGLVTFLLNSMDEFLQGTAQRAVPPSYPTRQLADETTDDDAEQFLPPAIWSSPHNS